MKTKPNQKSQKCDIQNIIQHYSHALYTKNLDLIHQTQKKISSDLLYYLKCMNLIFHQHNNNLSQNMEQSMRALRMFIKPSIQQKQCHIFPIFAYLAQRWDSAHLNSLLQSSNQDNSCTQANNESSDYYNSLPFTAMSAEQIYFLKSGKANSFFSDLTKNELVLQSTQCVCCAQVFIRDFFIQNANPFIPMLVELSPKKALDNKVLERYLNAICNSGGGVIIIGAKKDGRKLKTIGIRFQNQQQVRSKQSQILSTISKLEWKHRYLLQKVLVHTPFTTQNSSQISKEYMCLCFRILIFPEQVQKLKYVSCIRKGQNPSYEFYQFENGEEDKKGQVGIICKQILYNKMHEIYAFSKHNIAHNNHKNVFCSRPHPYYSKLFYKYYNEGKLNLSVSTDELESEENDSPFQQKQQQTSSFPYRSLLIVGSYSHDKNITKFLQFIEENNQPCQVYRPYRNQFPQCVRSVWVLEHNMNHNKLKFLLKNFTERCLKTELITTMPVQIILEIQSTKFTSYIEKNLIKKLQKYFVQYIKKQGKKKQESNKLVNGNKNQPQQEFAWYTKKKLMSLDSKHQESTSKLYLKFMNLQISLYSYMTFEELNLRPYFIPQDECKYSF